MLRAVRRRFAPAAVLGVVLLLLGGRWDAAGSRVRGDAWGARAAATAWCVLAARGDLSDRQLDQATSPMYRRLPCGRLLAVRRPLLLLHK